MSVNSRVSEQVNKLAEAYGTDRERYLAEKEKYWQILEEELTDEPSNGWIGYEDPVDYLDGCIQDIGTEHTNSEEIREALADYRRFCEIYERATGYTCRNENVIADAEAALELLAC